MQQVRNGRNALAEPPVAGSGCGHRRRSGRGRAVPGRAGGGGHRRHGRPSRCSGPKRCRPGAIGNWRWCDCRRAANTRSRSAAATSRSAASRGRCCACCGG